MNTLQMEFLLCQKRRCVAASCCGMVEELLRMKGQVLGFLKRSPIGREREHETTHYE